MNRIVTLAAATVIGLSAVQSASAGSGSHSGKYMSAQRPINTQHPIVVHHDKDHCKDKDDCKKGCPPKYMGGSTTGPIGTPENPFKPTPVSSNGFVFVNGHWERPRAGQTTVVDPTLGGPVVRDHRGIQGGGGVTVTSGMSGVVRDHRGTAANVYTGTVRDHRGTTNTNNDVVGVGGSPVDSIIGGLAGLGSAVENGLTGIGNAFGIGYGSITPVGGDSGVRDHRTNNTSNFGTNVRDHRN
jgi:hypothetical protein